MRYIYIALIAIPLASCESDDKAFVKTCLESDFTIKQCGLLLSMKNKADYDSSNALTVGMMGLAVANTANFSSVGRR